MLTTNYPSHVINYILSESSYVSLDTGRLSEYYELILYVCLLSHVRGTTRRKIESSERGAKSSMACSSGIAKVPHGNRPRIREPSSLGSGTGLWERRGRCRIVSSEIKSWYVAEELQIKGAGTPYMAAGRGSCTVRVLNWFYKFIAWSPPRHPRGTTGKGSSGFLEKGNSHPVARYRDRKGKIYGAIGRRYPCVRRKIRLRLLYMGFIRYFDDYNADSFKSI